MNLLKPNFVILTANLLKTVSNCPSSEKLSITITSIENSVKVSNCSESKHLIKENQPR